MVSSIQPKILNVKKIGRFARGSQPCSQTGIDNGTDSTSGVVCTSSAGAAATMEASTSAASSARTMRPIVAGNAGRRPGVATSDALLVDYDAFVEAPAFEGDYDWSLNLLEPSQWPPSEP